MEQAGADQVEEHFLYCDAHPLNRCLDGFWSPAHTRPLFSKPFLAVLQVRARPWPWPVSWSVRQSSGGVCVIGSFSRTSTHQRRIYEHRVLVHVW